MLETEQSIGLWDLVPTINEADLIVARFIDRDKATYDKTVAPLSHGAASDYLVTDRLRALMKKR